MWHESHAFAIPFVSGLVYNSLISTKGYNMPNWVYNGLTIEGNKESVLKLTEQMNQPFTMIHDSWDMTQQKMVKKNTLYPNPIFAFWNIIKPSNLDKYQEQMEHKPNASIQELLQFDGDDWYNWNVRNWGTKWDVGVSSDDTAPNTYMEGPVENGDNYVVYYNFETAWSRPMPALTKLSAQYPDLLFTLSYQEETGWGGECEILRGLVISESEYDSQCRDCDATDCMEYCENDCGEICNVCHWLGEADLDAVAECQDHKIYLETKVPEYRKAEA